MVSQEIYVPDIEVTEEVARVITAPSMIEDGDVSASAFELCNCLPRSGDKEGELSVNRTRFGYPQKNKIKWKPRTLGDKHYGYAILIVKEILDLSHDEYILDIFPMPNIHNLGHAGIAYYIRGEKVYGACDDIGLLEIRLTLASICTLIPFDQTA